MHGWLGLDGPISNGINKIGNMILVSLLWLICSLPVVTIGSATAALYYTTVKVVRRENGYVTQEFFNSFKANLKNGILFSVGYIAIALILCLDIYYVLGSKMNQGSMYMMIYYMIIFLVSGILVYLFPNLSRYKMKRLDLIKLSFYMAFRHLPTTIILLILYIVSGIITWLVPIPCILFIPGGISYISSFLLERIMLKYMGRPKADSEETKKWYDQ